MGYFFRHADKCSETDNAAWFYSACEKIRQIAQIAKESVVHTGRAPRTKVELFQRPIPRSGVLQPMRLLALEYHAERVPESLPILRSGRVPPRGIAPARRV